LLLNLKVGNMTVSCRLSAQKLQPGSCDVYVGETKKRACEATLKREVGRWWRIIKSAHLSRPEDYFSIYQSGCNHSCLKCHSWHFTQKLSGTWMSTDQIADMVVDYEASVTVKEPRKRATMWHATDLCHHCGSCILRGKPGTFCPKKLSADKIVLSPQGFGPARNIAAFTGGDIICCAEFYAEVAEKIKERCKVWILLETNGYGLTTKNLELLEAVDSFWLDIKAYEEKIYRNLCGTTNEWILKAPEKILEKGFVLEVLTLYIPGWVDENQIGKIARNLADLDPEIPFTILAFFPEYKLKHLRSPTLFEMLRAYFAARDAGLENVKLGNCGVFAKSEAEWRTLLSIVGREAIG
jgi:pyruvate-formate lyase-activating enzyme